MKLFDEIYAQIFGIPLSENVLGMIKNIGWLGAGTIAAKGMFFIIHILSGRILGAEIYGQFNVLFSITILLIIPFGILNSQIFIREVNRELNKDNKKSINFTFFSISSIWILSLCVIYFISKDFLFGFFSFREDLYFAIIILATSIGFFNIFEAILSASEEFRKQSLTAVVSHIAAFVVFLYFISIFTENIKPIYFSQITVFAVSATIYAGFVVKKLKPKIDKNVLRKMVSVGYFGMFAVIIGQIFAVADKLMLNEFVGEAAVGIYQGYYSASLIITGTLTAIVQKVIFPNLTKNSRNPDYFYKFIRFLIYSSLALLIFSPGIILITIYFYKFPIIFNLVALAILLTAFTSIIGFTISYLNAMGEKQIKISFCIYTAGVFLNVVLNYFLIPVFQINGAMFATLLMLIFVSLLNLFFIKRELLLSNR